jgi:hypothetical protein
MPVVDSAESTFFRPKRKTYQANTRASAISARMTIPTMPVMRQ